MLSFYILLVLIVLIFTLIHVQLLIKIIFEVLRNVIGKTSDEFCLVVRIIALEPTLFSLLMTVCMCVFRILTHGWGSKVMAWLK